jgi:hypothetical protein
MGTFDVERARSAGAEPAHFKSLKAGQDVSTVDGIPPSPDLFFLLSFNQSILQSSFNLLLLV